MSADKASYRRILTATSIIGGATVITILVGIFRTKMLALLTGPEGIGLLGILTNVSGLVTVIAGLGLANAAVRDIAAAPTPERQAEIRRALWLGSLPLALLGAAGLWLLREPVARLAADSSTHATLIGLTSIAVVLGVLASTQQAVLQAMRRIRELGIVRIGGAIGATLLAIPAAWLWGIDGVVVAVIAVPLATLVVAFLLRPRELPATARLIPAALGRDVRTLAALGAVMTATSALQLLSVWLVRTFIVQEDGLVTAGLFQAVVAITSMNIALVLGAMAADYFPLLSAAKDDAEGRNKIVNNQLHVALLLGAPLILVMVTAAPLVLTILYSSQFVAAEDMLRWQLLGDLLKIPGWAIGFVLLARGDRRTFVLSEVIFALAYVVAAMLLLQSQGLAGAGMAHFAGYLAYSCFLVAVTRRRHGIALSRENKQLIGLALGLSVGILLLSSRSELWAMAVGALASVGFGLYAVRELAGRSGMGMRRGAN